MKTLISGLCPAIAVTLLVACGGGKEPVSPSAESIPSTPVSTANDNRAVDEILATLSVEDKVLLVSGVGFSVEVGGVSGEFDRVPGTAGYTVPLPDAGLESIALADGPAGLRIWPKREGDENTYYATAFPIATLNASTWDTELVAAIGKAMGNEVKEYGVDVLLAPGMNIHRNPRGGRNFEYFSEDPLLSGKMAAAIVNGVQSNGVGATIKHYVANNQETNRMSVDTLVRERALREIYLKGFEIAAKESKPWAVMSSYNWVNGKPGSEHRGLLTDVLRGEWDYEGVVMTDWYAGDDPVAQLKAGNDLLMPGMPERTEAIREALDDGRLSEAELDINVRRILGMIIKAPTQHGYQYSDKPRLAENAKIARQVAAEGAVLLRNQARTLPLAREQRRVAAFGLTSYQFISGGTGSGDVNEAYTVSLVEGLANAGISITEDLAERYQNYIAAETEKLPPKKVFWELSPPIPEMPLTDAQIAEQAASVDVGLITIGRNSGEFQDRPLDADFYLTDTEKKLISQVSTTFHAQKKPVVVILNIGNVIETASWRDNADAILLAWQGGQEAGNAVADVLTGKTAPSGHLPTTFPMSYGDVPSHEPRLFPGVVDPDAKDLIKGGINWGKQSAEVVYEDGIYVGYRYYNTYEVPVAYPFGYGLSYSTFNITAGEVSKSGDQYALEVKVINSGDTAAKEVVQLYVSASAGGMKKPARELKAFAKTGLLQPGASETLSLQFSKKDLASFSEADRAWVTSAGDYRAHIARSAAEVVQSVDFKVPAEQRYPVKADLGLTK